MAIKKIVIKPADKKNTPNDPGRQAVPQRPADKKVTIRGGGSLPEEKVPVRNSIGGSGDTERLLRQEFRRAHTRQ